MKSSAKFVVPFRVSLQTSFLLNCSLFVIYIGAFVWLWFFELPMWLSLPIKLAVVIGFIFHLRTYLFRNSAKAITEMIWFEADDWQLLDAYRQQHQVKLLGNSLISPWLLVLNFRAESDGKKWSVVLMPDSVDSTTFRRLNAKLRLFSLETAIVDIP